MFDFLRRKRRLKPPFPSAKDEFNTVMNTAKDLIRYEERDEDKALILDYISHLMKTELKAALLVDGFKHTPCFGESNDITMQNPFPGTRDNKIGTAAIDFSKDIVLVLPWTTTSLTKALKHVSFYGYRYKSLNVRALYFHPLDITLVYNGRHHTAVASAKNCGIIKADVIDVTPTFATTYTDGEQWYSSDGTVIEPLGNYRLGVIFELCKLRQSLVLTPEYSYKPLASHEVAEKYLELLTTDTLFGRFEELIGEVGYLKVENFRLNALLSRQDTGTEAPSQNLNVD